MRMKPLPQSILFAFCIAVHLILISILTEIYETTVILTVCNQNSNRNLTLTPPINAEMHQNWPLGADSGGVKVKEYMGLFLFINGKD